MAQGAGFAALARMAVVWFAVAFLLSGAVHAQSPLDEEKALKARANELYRAGKYVEAVPLVKRVLELLELMEETSQEDNAHPAVWAPFVVVGEGAR